MKETLLTFLLVWQLTPSGFAQHPNNASQKPAPAKTQSQQPSQPSDEDVVKITTNLVQVDPVITD